MIVEQQSSDQAANFTKYYQFNSVATILGHVIDCFQTIVSDGTNPYHPPISWLTRKQVRSPTDELYMDMMEECSYDPNTACNLIDNNYNSPNYNNLNPSNTTNTGISRSPSPNVINNGQLSYSVKSRLERLSPELRKAIVSRTRDGCSPLFMACKSGHIDIVKYLLQNCDADIEQRGRHEVVGDHRVHSASPLWIATVKGRLDVVKLLLDRGANMNNPSDTGSTALRSVCFLCKDDELQSYPQQVVLEDNNNNMNNPDEALADSEQDSIDIYYKIVETLVEHGADISIPNHNGGTCLINSIHNIKLIGYLLDKGADINAAEHKSRTALHYAIRAGRYESALALLSRGADPMIRSNSGDDALQLSCLTANFDLFNHLIRNYIYEPGRLHDAYKLMGSTIFELNHDTYRVRDIWRQALAIRSEFLSRKPEQDANIHSDDESRPTTIVSTQDRGINRQCQPVNSTIDDDAEGLINCDQQCHPYDVNGGMSTIRRVCHKRRLAVFGQNGAELTEEHQLRGLYLDDFRMQSLLISERVLGSSHGEFLQRLVSRGTNYISSLRAERGVQLWLYALELRLSTNDETILQPEAVFACQAQTRLYLELLVQGARVPFELMHELATVIVASLPECNRLLTLRPISKLQLDLFDTLIKVLLNLMLAMSFTSTVAACRDQDNNNEHKYKRRLLEHIARQVALANPITSNGSNILHIIVTPGTLDQDAHKLRRLGAQVAADKQRAWAHEGPELELLSIFLGGNDASGSHYFEIDVTNVDGLSPLQVLCLSNFRASDKPKLIRQLVNCGAHLDRRCPGGQQQQERIRFALLDANVNPMQHVRLSCLAARALRQYELKPKAKCLPKNLLKTIESH